MCEHRRVPTTSRKREPRVEAVPLAWEPNEGDDRGALTETQREAATALWALFDEYFLERAPKVSRFGRRRQTNKSALDKVLPVIDDQRRNQVLLLDGKRGSGKTALLITLFEQWRRLATGAEAEDGFAEVSDDKGRVIPLALLDLRSLPKHTSVLVHVAGALRRIVEHLDVDQRPSSPGMSPPADDGSFAEASRLWRRFLSATAAMEINSGRRSATLDPESFAEELHESEQDRLDLGELFGKLMDRVVARFSERERITPVFVLAIDDADMNPARLEECFEVLEGLRHPRVVFVLTGDSKLFLQGLKT